MKTESTPSTIYSHLLTRKPYMVGKHLTHVCDLYKYANIRKYTRVERVHNRIRI